MPGGIADPNSRGLESDRTSCLSQHAQVVFAVADGQDTIFVDAQPFDQMKEHIDLALFVQFTAFGMKHRGGQGYPASGVSISEIQQISEAEIGEHSAPDDFGGSIEAVGYE